MRPTIICHMMTSVDGRIDCAMTAKLQGVEEYYQTLEVLDAPSTLSGRITGMLELAEPGRFQDEEGAELGREGFSKKTDSEGYEIIADTKGTLLWKEDAAYDKPHLILTSEKVTKGYLRYLDEKNISWIACGKEHIDLSRAAEILGEEFGVKRLAIVGGAHINGGFLKAGLVDEISILIGPGIDGREGMPAVLDGLPAESEPVPLELIGVESFEDGAVWLRYGVKCWGRGLAADGHGAARLLFAVYVTGICGQADSQVDRIVQDHLFFFQLLDGMADGGLGDIKLPDYFVFDWL